MKFSQLLVPTLKETPSEAEVLSHKLMLRAGLIRKLAAGIYTWLPLGLRVVRKIERIVREEMDRAGAQEILMPGVQPAELWQESGRWDHYGKELLRFKDRHQHDFCLAPTHEEVITDLVRREMRSYRDLPKNLYQIQTKFRDEVRPRFGVMRAREFSMKDAYSFDVDDEASALSYKKMYDAYSAIFQRLGLNFSVVEADSGPIGGSFSHEFMVLAETGEDAIVSCSKCGYAANLEKAEVELPGEAPPAAAGILAEVSTPGVHTVQALAEFLKISPAKIAKTMIYLADGRPVAAMVRGDREVNEVKLKNLTKAVELEMASPEVIAEITGGPLGFSGPMGLAIPVYVDQELFRLSQMVVGANKTDAHLTGLNLGRDVPKGIRADLRFAMPEDTCPRCGGGLAFARGIEVGHIFRLGTKYSEALGATFLDAEGQARPMVMGCYGIGITRIVAAAIEQAHDENGIIFPMPIAPLSVSILPMTLSGEAWEVAAQIYSQLGAQKVDALLDDRDLRPGVKFKDNDLIGIPLRMVVGPKGLRGGQVELKHRKGGRVEMLPVKEAASAVARIVRQNKGQFL